MQDGISPAWPLQYDAIRALLRRGRTAVPRAWPARRGSDRAAGQRALSPIRRSRTSRASRHCTTALPGKGLHPFHLPLGILLDEKDGKPTPTSICIRCDAFDGFPCLLNGKADAQVICVDPALRGASQPDAADRRLCLEARDRRRRARAVTDVRVTRNGREERYRADIVVVACGALSSALLLLRSANDTHPRGLANGSDQVGRNYMRHNQSVLMALMREPQRHGLSEDTGGQRLLFRRR